MLLKVLTAPDPILKTRAKEIDAVDDKIRVLMDNMLETMYAEDGAGLAANQVGELKRVVVLDLQDREDAHPEVSSPLRMANPLITDFSENYVEAEEGCLSVPDCRIKVLRPESITVEYLDYNNSKKILSTGGWLARVIQHEIDHLDGKVILDYLSPLKKDLAIRKLKKLKREHN